MFGLRCKATIFVLFFLAVFTPAFAQREGVAFSNFENSPSSGQPNILVNGHFTYGLQCYGDAAYSRGFDFFLSTDAHSPPYAAEIACKGSDCRAAAIFTPGIPVTAGRSYLLELYTKCPTGGSGFIYIPQTTMGTTYEFLSCNDKWNLSIFHKFHSLLPSVSQQFS